MNEYSIAIFEIATILAFSNSSGVSTSDASSPKYCSCYDIFKKLVIVEWIVFGILLVVLVAVSIKKLIAKRPHWKENFFLINLNTE